MEKMSEENTEEVRELEAQIEQLQAEVAVLQRQQQDNQKNNQKDIPFSFRKQMQNAISFMCGQRQGGGKEMVLSGLKGEVKDLEEYLNLQTKINYIGLNHCIIKTLQSSKRKQIQQYYVSGHCNELDLYIEFQLSEVKGPQVSKRMMNNLNVVMDTSDPRSFTSFLSWIEESGDFLLFFRTLRTYLYRCDVRRRIFQHFKEKYPSVVSLLADCRSEVMILNHPELPGCVLTFHWSVKVSKTGQFTTEIELLTNIPERALLLFPSHAVSGTVEAFQSLLRILGPEAAMASVIMAVSLSQDT